MQKEVKNATNNSEVHMSQLANGLIEFSEDIIVQKVVKKMLERSQVGIEKYGTTLERDDLKLLDWIEHAQEELMDGILYLERIKFELNQY